MSNPPLRIVEQDQDSPLPHDEALAKLNEHWKAAREAYADAIGAAGDHYLRHLIVPPSKRTISRSHMAAIRDHAHLLAQHATRMADELDRAVATYGRAERE